MGLFNRKKDAQGLYVGDAPASAPGLDGAEPSAYTGAPLQDHSQHVVAPDGYQQLGQPLGPQLGQPLGPPAGTPFGPIPGSPPGQPFGPPSVLPPNRFPIASPSTGLARGIRIAIIGVVLAVLVTAGITIAIVIGAMSRIAPHVDPVVVGDPPGTVDGRHTGATALGEPVSIRTADGSFDITVFEAVAEPADAWGYAQPGSGPMLVVDAQIARTDAGTAPVEFMGWNWSVIDGGQIIRGDIITHYLPSLDGPELVGGQTVRGFVTFRTDVTDTSLTVAASPSSPGLATWNIAARTPAEVHGIIGQPVQPDISRTGFSVTIGEPQTRYSRSATPPPGVSPSAMANDTAKSGRFLVIPVAFTPAEGTSGHLGNVDSEAFVFVPDGEPALFPTVFAVDDAFSFVSLDASGGETGNLAFDTAAAGGTLQLRDQADRTIATWEITLG